ncbi:MAG: hypothetical protein ACE5FT_06140 [Candidatus Nanoarchaeia archaeon]
MKLGIALEKSDADKIRLLEYEFLAEFWPYIPQDAEPCVLNCTDISMELKKTVGEGTVVSLDRMYYPWADGFVDVTRGSNGLQPRPDMASINEQVSSLPGRFTLVDVGVFQGETLTDICERMEASGKQVDRIIVGIANRDVRLVQPYTALNTYTLCDWMELRDLIGIDGKMVDVQERRFKPYWDNLVKGATIPVANESVVRGLCKVYNSKLLSILDIYDLSALGKVEECK